MGLGSGHNVVVKVNGGHMTVRANDVGHERSVKPGARANFQHPVAGLQFKLLQHNRHHSRLGRRADGFPCLKFGGNHAVAVNEVERGVGQKKVARDGAEGCKNGRCLHRSIRL